MIPAISVSHLNKTYAGGFTALKDINLEIRHGEIFALLGPNGAGKTTLISIVCGIVNPSSGRVAVEDIRQLFCKMVGGQSRSYRLYALLTGGVTTPLLVRLRNPDTALYLEELLEARLGIAHERVPGEYR